LGIRHCAELRRDGWSASAVAEIACSTQRVDLSEPQSVVLSDVYTCASSGVDSWAWRLLFVLLLLCWGTGLVLYVLMWIFIPKE
jgi:hypothetical protein